MRVSQFATAAAETIRRCDDAHGEGTVRVLGRWGTGRLRGRIERRRERTALFDPSTLDGRRIDAREFFGPGFVDGGLTSLVEWDRSNSLDFTYAVCQPPYGLQVGDAELEELFGDIVRHVLGDPNVSTEIWSWDTAWSPYFDAGREWWGTGLWTVDVQGSVVVVLASATD